MTDSELTKALKRYLKQGNCNLFYPYRKDSRGGKYVDLRDIYDLIKRQNSALIKEKNKNSKLRNELNHLRTENKKLNKKIDHLSQTFYITQAFKI